MNALRVYWIPQIPMPSFYVPVRTLREAKLILDTLGYYDLFQLKHRIKRDYCNAGGLQEFDPRDDTDGTDGSWCDWYDDESGYGIDDLTMEQCEAADLLSANNSPPPA